jgi:hypothetical protein
LPSTDSQVSAAGLANAVLGASRELRVEPGTLALCFGYSTGTWQVANGAMSRIYATAKPVWREINQVAVRQLTGERVPDDAVAFLTAVMGGVGPA